MRKKPPIYRLSFIDSPRLEPFKHRRTNIYGRDWRQLFKTVIIRIDLARVKITAHKPSALKAFRVALGRAVIFYGNIKDAALRIWLTNLAEFFIMKLSAKAGKFLRRWKPSVIRWFLAFKRWLTTPLFGISLLILGVFAGVLTSPVQALYENPQPPYYAAPKPLKTLPDTKLPPQDEVVAIATSVAVAAPSIPVSVPVAVSTDAKSYALSQVGAVQFACLDSLWTKESGWRVDAYNPSGAYGIPQSLPASKMASFGADYLTNPITQINWGLSYISAVYQNPCNAWAHSVALNWY